ncbi:MAG: hypothetical protein R3296_00100 [Oleiphilaceae bacterium]|nr:hypothetical protein [Oleiphilaceae bacterium]
MTAMKRTPGHTRTRMLPALALLPLAMVAAQSQAQDSCHPLSMATCGLPFPSDHLAQPDATSPTGQRLSLGNDLIRAEVLAQLPQEAGISPEAIFNGDSGFSAASPVLFEFNPDSQFADLPGDGGAQVQAWDLTTGERLPLRAAFSDYARSSDVSAPAEVLEVHPRSRWHYGHRILVVVKQGLLEQGSDQPGFSDRLAGLPANDYLSDMQQQMQQLGINPRQVHSATLFTVRDRQEVSGPMEALVDRTWNSPRGLRNMEVEYLPLNTHQFARVTGEFRVDNYRRQQGTGMVDFDASPGEQWAGFRLTLPRAARDGAAPVVFYIHGLGANMSSDSLVTGMNAELGVATFSVNFPNHGERAEADGGGVFDNLSVDRLPVQVGMITQAPIDFAAAQRTLQTELATLDLAGPTSWRHWWGQYADGVPDLDTRRVMIQGTSLGGVLGSTYGALAPELDGAIYQVTGNGIISILSESTLWDSAFSGLMPEAANGAEALLLRGAVQQLLDHGDGINYVDRMRHPQPGRNVRPTLVLAGAGDRIVPNNSSIATALLADLPIVGEKLFPMPGVRESSDFDPEGFGMIHYPPLVMDSLFGEDLSGASAHGVFVRQSASDDQQDWMERFFLDNPQ